MSISIFYEDTGFRYRGWKKIKPVISELIFQERKEPGDINIIITSDNRLIEINRQFLEHDYYTDVITFNYNEEGNIEGEIYISADTVKENAKIYKVSINDEISRVIIHGVLHLTGYDDKTEKQKAKMRKMEDYWLAKIGS